MADALVWQLTKDNNAFLMKRERSHRSGQVMFTKDPKNLMSVNTFKYSGLVNSKAVGINVSDKNIVLTVKVFVYSLLNDFEVQ